MIEKKWIKKMDIVHPYPAKFTIELALEKIEKYSELSSIIYDPFCGSGTTLFAADILGRKSYGTDINHIAILISSFKTTKYSNQDINNIEKFLFSLKKEIKNKNSFEDINKFFYKNIDFWFKEEIILGLSFLKQKIWEEKNYKVKLFLKLIFSSLVNKVSNQESDTRYAAKYKSNVTIDFLFNEFFRKSESTLIILHELTNLKRLSNPILYNSKNSSEIIKEKIDLIITSPPYPNTYDYYLYHKHRMNWLEMDVIYSMKEELGSRREFSSLKKPLEKFNEDIIEVFENCNKILKKNAKIIIIMGDGKINGKFYNAKEELIPLFSSKFNWKLISYSYTYLHKTSKSFQNFKKTNDKKEHIFILEKK